MKPEENNVSLNKFGKEVNWKNVLPKSNSEKLKKIMKKNKKVRFKNY